MSLCQEDVLFMLCLLGKDLLKNSEPKTSCFFVFVDLEKAFDQVSREVIYFALRRKGVLEYFVDGVIGLFKGWKTAVSTGELSSSFFVKVDVDQGSALSPLLFIMLVDVLTEDVRHFSIMELLHADNLVLCGESFDEIMGKYGRW